MLALSCEAFLRLAPERSCDSEEKDVGVFALSQVAIKHIEFWEKRTKVQILKIFVS